ncbi:MAG: hypothetical protein ACLP0J_15120 [Solirubrobacteraceae bacterium]
MRTGSEIIERGPDEPAPDRRTFAPLATPNRGLDRFERSALLAFVAVSAWVLGLDLWQVLVDRRVWTGTDGLFLTDQMQYLAWIQSASRHVLVSDLFVLHSTSADYLQPLVALSGALTALGLAAWLSLLVWQPVAVLAMFFAVRAYTRGTLAGRGARRAALVIGLFGGSLPAIGDIWPGFWSWGYPYSLIAIAATAGALLAYERAHAAGRISWTAPALGALAAWLHPWQGEALILIVIGAELALRPGAPRGALSRRRNALAAVTVIATALPLLYYLVLAHADPQWGLAQAQSKHTYPLAMLALALAPFLAASALAYRDRPRSFIAAATRIWPPAALVVFLVSETGISATPLHALAGITIPLGVLSVDGLQAAGWQRLPGRRLLGPLLVAAATIPTTIDEMKAAVGYLAPAAANANFIAPGEQRALNYLAADPQPGGVLTRDYLGLLTPAQTGRHTYLGACQWSEPNCEARERLVHRVFETPGIAARTVRAEVLGTGARFVLASDCTLPGKNLNAILAPLTSSRDRFGCATLYEIHQPDAGSRPR